MRWTVQCARQSLQTPWMCDRDLSIFEPHCESVGIHCPLPPTLLNAPPAGPFAPCVANAANDPAWTPLRPCPALLQKKAADLTLFDNAKTRPAMIDAYNEVFTVRT